MTFVTRRTGVQNAARAGRFRRPDVGALLSAVRRAPAVSLANLTGGGPILIVAPHPDDETLGCGALLAACAAARIETHVFILTDGARSHPVTPAWSARRIARRRAQEAHIARRRLGLPRAALHLFDKEDGGLIFDLPSVERMAARVARQARALNARRLFCTWVHDPHPDHLATAVLASLVRRAAPRLQILHYPVWGRFMPEDTAIADRCWLPLRFDGRPWRNAKRDALGAFRSQTTRLIGETAEGFLLTPAQRKAFLSGDEYFFG